LSEGNFVICMILSRKYTVRVNHMFEVKVAVFWGEHRAVGK